MRKQRNINPYRVDKLSQSLRIFLSKEISALAGEKGLIAGVNDVEVAPDRKHARVWLSIIKGGEEQLLKLTQKNKRFLSSKIFSEMPIPVRLDLTFFIDEGPHHAQDIAELLKQADLPPSD